ncbi:MAG: chromate transporter [Hyphomicrobiales bacterium]
MSESASEHAPAPEVSLWQLAFAFNEISLASFGGGLSAWARRVIVEERRWLSDVEFLSAQTLCRVLPGANQINMAVYVGARFRGPIGAIFAVIGLTAVPVALILALAIVYFRTSQLPQVKSVLAGIAPVAIAMSASTAWKAGKVCLTGIVPIAFAAVMFAVSAYWRLPLYISLLLLGPPALFWAWPRPRRSRR